MRKHIILSAYPENDRLVQETVERLGDKETKSKSILPDSPHNKVEVARNLTLTTARYEEKGYTITILISPELDSIKKSLVPLSETLSRVSVRDLSVDTLLDNIRHLVARGISLDEIEDALTGDQKNV